MKNHATILCCLLLCCFVYAQQKEFVGAYAPNSDKSVYTAMQNIWYSNEAISYICILPVINNQIDPAIPFREGEGRTEKYLFEANLNAQIPIAMGRNHGNHLAQTTRLVFDFGFNIRMAQDSSHPLLPNNNMIGLSINRIIWNSHTSDLKGQKGKFFSFENWYDKHQTLHNLSLDISIRHYSNGQQAGFFLTDSATGSKRNDYKKGDFSTNYIRLGGTYSYLNKRRDILSGNLSYQYDGNFGGPLVYSEEQEKSYGHHRILGFLQYRRLLRLKSRSMSVQNVCDSIVTERMVKRYQELVLRWESELITDPDLSNYISTQDKHRFNQHLYLKYTRPNWRAFGFMAHAYYGRDYSNIRYDLPIFAIMGGVCVEFNKYRPILPRTMWFN